MRNHYRRSVQGQTDRSRGQYELPNDANYRNVPGRQDRPTGKRVHQRLKNPIFNTARHVEECPNV